MIRSSSLSFRSVVALILVAGIGLAGCSNNQQEGGSTQGAAVQVRPPGQTVMVQPQPAMPAIVPQVATPPGTVSAQPLPATREQLGPPATVGASGETPSADAVAPAAGAAPALRRPSPDAVRIGMLLPLSGPNAAVGKTLLDAAQLALFDLPDGKVQLLPRDTEIGGAGARGAAESVLAEGAEIIFGPLFATQVAPVAEAARARNVPVITFSTDRSVAGNGVYLINYTPEEQVRRVVAFAASKGQSKFAILVPDSPFGRLVAQTYDEAVRKANGTIVQSDVYPPDAADLTVVARRFVRGGSAGYDTLMITDAPARLRILSQMLAYFDVDNSKVRLIGTGQWDDPAILGEPLLIGGWFAAPSPQSIVQFNDRFQAAYGRRPPRVAALAYDAVSLAVALAGDNRANAFTAQNLTDPNGFAGFGGIFRFRPDGVAEHGLAILEVEAKAFKLADPAPDAFPAGMSN